MATYRTRQEVHRKALEAVGKRLGDIDTHERLSSAKGSIGQMVEESHFEYRVNSEAAPDFKEAGVELKVTPFRRNKDGSVSAKERLVLSMIDYMSEHSKEFETSAFWHKNQCLEMMFYEHVDGASKNDFVIEEAYQYEYPAEDLAVIRRDWEYIIGEIRQGRAHELSESATMYLGACTKAANSSEVRRQPFSDTPAQKRAYCLKQSYMTRLLRTSVFGAESDEHVLPHPEVLKDKTFDEHIVALLEPFFGKTQNELFAEFDIPATSRQSKAVNELLLGRMLGVRGKISQSDEFLKAGMEAKTIRVGTDGHIRESMSFPAFEFVELASQEWAESDLRVRFEETRYMFAVFVFRQDGQLVFDRVVFWHMPNGDLSEVRRVWERTRDVIRNGVVLTPRSGHVSNNLPKASESRVCHVRPHARDSADTYPLPDGRRMSKQCFWLNSTYVEKQIGAGA